MSQEQEEPIMNEPYVQEQMPPNEAATLLEQTNPAALLVRFEHLLKGEVYDEYEGVFKPYCAPYLNSLGVSQVMFMMHGLINSNCILSNLTDSDVKNIILDFNDDITDLLILNYKSFAMDKRNISTIVGHCRRNAYFALKRGYLGGEKEFLKKTSKEVISTTTHSGPKREQGVNNFWSLFKKAG
jgi:hypothetical protein